MTDQFLAASNTIPADSATEPGIRRSPSILPGVWLFLGGAVTAGWWAGLGWATIRLAQYAFFS